MLSLSLERERSLKMLNDDEKERLKELVCDMIDDYSKSEHNVMLLVSVDSGLVIANTIQEETIH